MIHDPYEATDRLLGFLETGLMPVVGGEPIELSAHSICVHGDSDGAVAMARMIRDGLCTAGIQPVSFVDATT
jgi:UPF0271 protein